MWGRTKTIFPGFDHYCVWLIGVLHDKSLNYEIDLMTSKQTGRIIFLREDIYLVAPQLTKYLENKVRNQVRINIPRRKRLPRL